MRKIKLLVLTTAIIAIALSGCNTSTEKVEEIPIEEVVNNEESYKEEVVQEETTVDSTEEIYIEPEIKSVTISFAGDCTLGEYKGQGAGNQFKDYFNEFGADYFFEDVRGVFENDDLTLVNLEGPLTDKAQTANKEFPIKGSPDNIDVISGSSVEVVNLANNHIYDCGNEGFEDTKALLDSADIGYCGENTVYVTDKNGIRVGFLGYRGWYYSDELKNQIYNDISYLKNEEKANVVVVVFHYGEERHYYNNDTQSKLSKYAIDCGADIIIGGHPHVIQGIEIYNGKTICYSMGNFSFGANKNPSDKDTFIYQQTFNLLEDGTVEYSNHTIIPCSISSEKDRNNYQPMLLINEDHDRVISRLKEYSSKYETSIFDILTND